MIFKRPYPKFIEIKNNLSSDIRERRMLQHFKNGKISSNFIWFYQSQLYMQKISKQTKAYSTLANILEKLITGITLILISPILVLIAAIIYISDGRPIFFSSPRLGKYGVPFTQVKFRTLYKNAKESNDSYNKIQVNCPNNFMLFLRNHKLDELPNLFNVLAGTMSIIGPRPIGPDEYDFAMKDGHSLFRLATNPGITGLWQTTSTKLVTGRKRIFRDAIYVANKGLLLDLKIIALTFVILIKGEKKIIHEKTNKNQLKSTKKIAA
jgi:lipopolysaccharide/colanic/teichoic acid biosynthesis glycosyltransferase